MPLLRSPPFPGGGASTSLDGKGAQAAPADPAAIDRLFAAIREARVGGTFWAPAVGEVNATAAIAIRARSVAETERFLNALPAADRTNAIAVPGGDFDPWSVLDRVRELHAHGNDEWVAIAVIAGCTVQLLSPGRFGTPGEAPAALRSRVFAELMAARYRDPFTGAETDIDAAVTQLAEWRTVLSANAPIVAACGMAWWKRHEIRRFLWSPQHPLRLFRSEERAIAHAARRGGALAVWPSRVSASLPEQARARGVPLVRIEDGFVRSVGLGSNLVPPSSIVADRTGIHYDAGCPSDLETLLAAVDFPPALLERARQLRKVILAGRISKYGGDGAQGMPVRRPGARLVLVPAQVEDDMSVKLGGGGLSSNLELLRRVRALEPDAEIWFRPHPDVDAGHRVGAVRDADALEHADRIVRGGDMARLLDTVDAVHVLTSLTGFEALLRGRDVTCHGMPFYAGWGLTRDLGPASGRRGRKLALDELVAGVLILYPRYLDPVTGLPCSPEVLIRRITAGAARNRLGWIMRLRQWQGRLARPFKKRLAPL